MEIWKDIKFYHPLQNIEYDYTGHYQVSNYGRVRSLKSNGKILKPHKQKRPAGKIDLQITLCKECQKNRFMISRLVAFMFIENKYPYEKIQVNHIDENTENNHVDNLEWVSCRENLLHGTARERASKKMKGFNHSEKSKEQISKSMLGEKNHFYGKKHSEEMKYKQMINKGFKIVGTNIKDGSQITFNSIREADRNGFDRCCIQQCLNPNGKQKQHKGYTWKKV